MLRPITRRQSGLLPTIRREVPAAEGPQLFTRTFDDTALMADEYLKQQAMGQADDGLMADATIKTFHKMIDDLLCRTM